MGTSYKIKGGPQGTPLVSSILTNIFIFIDYSSRNLQVIDHIIVENQLIISENPKIISKVKNYEIFYNLSEIETMLQTHELLNLNEKKSDRILEE